MALRILFHTGFFGSDEVTYIEASSKLASGDWSASSYIGSTRYGMNLPVALCIYLFGLSEASTNLWPFVCSVGEVVVVYAIARWLWTTRVAVLSAGLLAILPLHVHFAGRMMADPPLAFFLTLSVALILRAANSRSALLYLLAGLAWGGIFWVKESVAILYLPVFLFLTVFRCRLTGPWPWVIVGIVTSVIANCLLMFFVAGDPLHLFNVIGKGIGKYSEIVVETSPWYYLYYLFADIRHTFLLGLLALAGVIRFAIFWLRARQTDPNTLFAVLWMLLLVGLFSFAVVSFSPVKFVMKQTNYMLIFFGPLSLVVGWYLASLPRRIFLPLGTLILAGSVALAALQQQSITVFTANSKAAYSFLRDRPSAFLIASTNNERAVYFYSMLDGRLELRDRVMSLTELAGSGQAGSLATLKSRTAGKEVFGLLDLQNVSWGIKRSGIQRLKDVPSCWRSIGVLEPASLGQGRWVSMALVATVNLLPESVSERLAPALRSVSVPAPAHLFQIDAPCLDDSLR